jgi:hypothetical protein
MRKHLLAGTAVALLFTAVTAAQGQVGLPGYAASVSGAASTTTSTAFNIIQFGAGWNSTYRLYVTDVHCGRTDAGTSAIRVAFNDTASTVLVVPANSSAGGGFASIDTPSTLVVAADTNFTGTVSANTTTVFCSAQGFVGN